MAQVSSLPLLHWAKWQISHWLCSAGDCSFARRERRRHDIRWRGGNRLLLRPTFVVVFLLVLLRWHPTSSSLCFLFVLLCWYPTSSSTVLLTICYLLVMLCWHQSSSVSHLILFVLLRWNPTTGVAHLCFSLSSCVEIQLVQLHSDCFFSK